MKTVSDYEMAINDVLADLGILADTSCSTVEAIAKAVAALASPAEVVERPAPVSHVAGSDREDAERFRALMRCGRIKMQGSSGVDPKTGERNGNNVHFGAEFWPEPIPAGFEEHYEASTKWGRFCIKALADAILEEEARATPAPSPNMRGDLGITEIATLRRAVGLADAIRAAQRAYMADRGNERLGRAVGEACEAYDAHRSGNPSPQPNLSGDGEAAIIECLSAGKAFVFDPATNFLHADDGTVEGGIRYAPAPVPHLNVCATEGCEEPATERFEAGGVGSIYCAACVAKVAAIASAPQPREDVSSTPQQEPARLREEIERLEKALETAREALEPFGKEGGHLQAEHFSRAREVYRALSQKKEG